MVSPALVAVAAAAATATGPAVVRVAIDGEPDAAQAERLRPLVSIRTGRPYEPAEGRRTMERLVATGAYASVVITERAVAGGLAVTVRLTRLTRLAGWRFTGNGHLEDAALARALGLGRGQAADAGRFDAYARRLAARYALAGFPKATARFALAPAGSGLARLEARVEEGPPLTLGALRVEGLADGDAVKEALALKPGDRLTALAVTEALARLQANLVSIAGFDARAEHHFATPQGRRLAGWADLAAAGADRLDLVVRVTPGHAARVEVQADVPLAAETLSEALPLLRAGDTAPAAIAASAEALARRYRAEGYPQARVTPEVGDEGRRVTFHVVAGPRYRVGAIRFEGVSAYPPAEIEEAFATRSGGAPFDAVAWRDDLARLARVYRDAGYLSARVEGQLLERDAATGLTTLVARVSEGERAQVRHLVIEGLPPSDRPALAAALPMAPGGAYEPGRLPEVPAAAELYLASRGYPRARADARFEAASGTLTLAVAPGPRVKVGRVLVRGNLKTRESVILERVRLRHGDWLDAAALASARERVYALGAFERVRWEPVGAPIAEGAPVDLVLEVTERPTGALALSAGLGDLSVGRGLWRNGAGAFVGASFADANWLGAGRPLRAEGQLSPTHTTGLVSLRDSLLLGDQATAEVGASYLSSYPFPDLALGMRSASAFVGVSRPLGPDLAATVRYAWGPTRYETPEGASLAAELARRVGLVDRLDSLLSVGLTRDTRDDLFDPRRGGQGELMLDVATPLLGGTLSYAGPRFRMARYWAASAGPVLALAAEGGALVPLAPAQILPADARFYVGGTPTLRGFGYRGVGVDGRDGVAAPGAPVVGGQAYWVARAEGRFPLSGAWGAVAFLDAGDVWASVAEPGFAPKAAVGLGVRYATPIGPLRLDYAVQLAPVPAIVAPETALSLGLGHAF